MEINSLKFVTLNLPFLENYCHRVDKINAVFFVVIEKIAKSSISIR